MHREFIHVLFRCQMSELRISASRKQALGERECVRGWVSSLLKPNEIHAFRIDCLFMMSKDMIHDAGPCKLYWIDLSGI